MKSLSIILAFVPIFISAQDLSITCPENIFLECTEDTGAYGEASAEGGCTGIQLSFTDIITEGICPANYEIERTWLATNDCDEEIVCTQIINISDNAAPQAISSLYVLLDCEVFSTDSIYFEVEDNCSELEIEFLNDDFLSGGCCGLWTANYQVIDVCDNSMNINLYVSPIDTVPPVILPISDLVFPCGDTSELDDFQFEDNCSFDFETNIEIDTLQYGCPLTVQRTFTVSHHNYSNSSSQEYSSSSSQIIQYLPDYGCIDSGACNFNPFALTSDNSCLYTNDSCNDFNDSTTNDTFNTDCECIGIIIGCTDDSACNYIPAAEIDDGSCHSVGDACNDNDENTINEIYQANCECLGQIYGCMDSGACNFNPDAVIDPNQSCKYPGDSCDIPNNFYDCFCVCVESTLEITPPLLSSNQEGFTEENLVLESDEIQYTIDFQNTTGLTVNTAEVTLNLSSLLDINTLIVDFSTHEITQQIIEQNSVHFILEELNLVDFSEGIEESTGRIEISILPFSNALPESVIQSNATIKFDCQQSINSNEHILTVQNCENISATILQDFPISVCIGDSLQIEIDPNLADYWECSIQDSTFENISQINYQFNTLGTNSIELNSSNEICPSYIDYAFVQVISYPPTDYFVGLNSIVIQNIGTYQWYLNEEPIEDAIDQSYTPEENGIYSFEISNEACSSLSDPIDFTLGILEHSSKKAIIQPNPMEENSYLIFSHSSSRTIKLLDSFGRVIKIWENINSPELKIQKDDLASGNYLIHILESQEEYIIKLVIE